MYKLDPEAIGEKLKELRGNMRLPLREFGEKIDISYVTVSNIETGKRLPTLSILVKYCNLFNIDINKLLKPEDY